MMQLSELNLMDVYSENDIKEQASKDGITHISTGIAVVRDEKILMVRRAKDDFLGGYYELPGGGVDKEETILESAYREVQEETGLTPNKTVATFKGFDYSTDKKPKVRQINFIFEVDSDDVVLSEEHDDFEWVDTVMLANINTTENMRACVYEAFAKIHAIY